VDPAHRRRPDSGLWLIFIGWFLNVAAAGSYRMVAIRDVLQGVSVGQLMRRHLPPLVPRAAPIAALVDNYLASGENLFVVGEAPTELIGVVRAQDVKRVSRGEWPNTPIGQIMTPLPALPHGPPDTEAFKALKDLAGLEVDAMVVVSKGAVIGILRRKTSPAGSSCSRTTTTPACSRASPPPGGGDSLKRAFPLLGGTRAQSTPRESERCSATSPSFLKSFE